MNQSPASQHTQTTLPAVRLAFIQASWHKDIVDQARTSFFAELSRLGVLSSAVRVFDAPGAFEIPLLAKRLASTGHYAAIVACGLVVDGGIYRHDFVATAVIDGLMAVQLETGVPVLSCVLTPHHFHDHAEHRRYFAEHFVQKGAEVARACVQTVSLHLSADTFD